MVLFSIKSADNKSNNIIYNSPHSGELFPDDFLDQISIDKHILLCSGDSFVDRLFDDAPKYGSSIMANNYARSFMDTNRAAYELDKTMFSGDIPEHLLDHSRKVDLGYGSIAKYAYTRQDIYMDTIPFKEAEERINKFYFPVHKQLEHLLNENFNDFGYSLLIDCHSMPSNEFLDIKTIHSQPDIVIGDLYGNSCSDKITEYIKHFFEDADLSVAMNDPFAGGYNTDHYGRPSENKHAIQIEINKSLYMDEHNRCPNSGFHQTKSMLNILMKWLDRDMENLI
ncbi:N-formylglutamate amidohydrolase [Pseudemcibacter aquimaris]|uniref:N-formylglutamate amidohydrolase n=1 Tax=Pseudemcibacter aquimaris TaxID=2857064 RepID=UPI002011437C|nr:N-formylglutamate amidohydrolase [Pseudemcibacter aquimaris]MCC3860154.1 N-formylglutamate amidohydrolase [Pseudemcibacter aquimaris]WDU57481.1 N-formylglutamate amidohydrolase [Pseudemcibacter aquimaris]